MAVEKALEVVPAVDKPLDKMTTPELLRNAAHFGLIRLNEIIQWNVDKDNLEQARLVADAALNCSKLLARVEEAGLRAMVAGDAVAELGNRLRALEKSQSKAGKAKT